MPSTTIAARGRNGMLWIEPYYRIRDGVLQHVRGHWRRLPLKQLPNVFRFPLSS